MKINFRQGIQRAPLVSGQPSFLVYNSGNNTITVAIGTDLVRVTAAYKSLNYLIEEREDFVGAWGPFNWNPLWGPAPTSPFTSYLYWNISLATGEVTRGFTPHAPLYGATAPSTPAIDQHWFDTINFVMKVWDGSFWRTVIRVFAGSFNGGTNVVNENSLGSQVGLIFGGTEESWPDHGYILYGIDLKAIRNGVDASFITTSTPLLTNHGSFSSPIRLELSNSTSLANSPIPAFYAITSNGDGTVELASGSDPLKKPIGITTVPAIAGDPVDVVFKGIVYNDQWDWDPQLGRDLYCGVTGELYQDVTGPTNIVKVGVVLSPRTILVDIDTYGSSTGGSSTGGGGVSWPLRAPTQYNSPGDVPFSFEDSVTTGMQFRISDAIAPQPKTAVFRDTFTFTGIGYPLQHDPDLETYPGAYYFYGGSGFVGINGSNLEIPNQGNYQGVIFDFQPISNDPARAKYVEFKFDYSEAGTGGFILEFDFGVDSYFTLQFGRDNGVENLQIVSNSMGPRNVLGSFAGAVIRYEFQNALQQLFVNDVLVDTTNYAIEDTLGTPALILFDQDYGPGPAANQLILVDYVELGYTAVQLVPGKPILELKRDDHVGLRLTTIQNDDTVVETDEANVRGLRVSTYADPVIRTGFDNVEEFRGLIRGVRYGTNQYKLELHAGVGDRESNTGGATGYQAITPYQHHVFEADYKAQLYLSGGYSGYSGAPLDFSIAKSIVYHLDTLDVIENRLQPINGLAGESYEILLKHAAYSPGVTAFYKYPQHSSFKGFVGPIVLTALEGINGVATIQITPGDQSLDYFTTRTGRPKQIVVSNNGYGYSGVGGLPLPGVGNTGYQLPQNIDTAFILTTGNRLEVFGYNGLGTRMVGTIIAGALSQSSELSLSTPLNLDVKQDGEMWMNTTTNRLYVNSTYGDIWCVDASQSLPAELYHNAIPNPNNYGTVYSLSGSESSNAVFALMRNSGGDLVFYSLSDDLSTINSVTLVTATNFAGVCNALVIDDANQLAYVTLPEMVSNSIRIIVIDLADLTIAHEELFPLTRTHNLLPPKFYPALRNGVLYIPVMDETLFVDVTTWAPSNIWHNSASVDRYTLDERTTYLVGTCGSNGYKTINTADGTNLSTTGAIIVNLTDTFNEYSQLEVTFAASASIPWVTGTVADLNALLVTNADEGAIFTTLNNGVSYVCNGTNTWEPINNGIYLSCCHDDLVINFDVQSYDWNKVVTLQHPSTPLVTLRLAYDYRVRYDQNLPNEIGGFHPDFSDRDNYLVELSKVEQSKMKFQDQNCIWLVKSIYRYTFPVE